MTDAAPPEVVVYSTPFCAPCERLKGYLTARGVPFTVRDLMMDEEAADRLESLGIRSAPALEVGGRVYAGAQLSQETIGALLGLGDQGG
jgi:glutaredoxin-like protein NrdH